jgi:hypothetical protein
MIRTIGVYPLGDQLPLSQAARAEAPGSWLDLPEVKETAMKPASDCDDLIQLISSNLGPCT